MLFGDLFKSILISIISLIVYVVVTDKLDEKKDNIFKENVEKDKIKEYLIIIVIISVSSFLVINMSSKNTELVPVKMSTIKEPLLNNKPPF